jgi:hypothetical protein
MAVGTDRVAPVLLRRKRINENRGRCQDFGGFPANSAGMLFGDASKMLDELRGVLKK